MKIKKTKIDDIIKVINKWSKDNKGLVEFHGAFWRFKDDKDFEIIDDRMIAYGTKDSLKISMEELFKDIDEEKDDFISW